jgi:hypothetical protein
MNAAFMPLELHERGIHAIRSGVGATGVTEVRFGCPPRLAAAHEPARISSS